MMIIVVWSALLIAAAAVCLSAVPSSRRWVHRVRVVRAEAPRGIAELEGMLADHARRSGHPRGPSR